MTDRRGVVLRHVHRRHRRPIEFGVHYDRRLDSLAAYLHAVGAELLMAIKVGDQLIQVVRPERTQVVTTSDGVGLKADAAAVGAR